MGMRISRHRFWAGMLVLVTGLAGSAGVPAMGFFKSQVLFSPVSGVVTLNGAPVAGAEIVQSVDWATKEGPAPRSVTSDANGRFAFDAIEGSSMAARVLPLQPSMNQRLVIRHQGVEYDAYRHGKLNYDLNGENEGKPLVLECELSRQPDFFGKFYGICRLK